MAHQLFRDPQAIKHGNLPLARQLLNIGYMTLTVKPKGMTMTKTTTPLPLRNDTILGVCEAIGRDFGFNPLWLRLAFILPLFVAPMVTIGAYLALGAVVAAANHFLPSTPASEQVVEAKATVVEEDVSLPMAA